MSELQTITAGGDGLFGWRRHYARLSEHRLVKSMSGDGLRARVIRGSGWTIMGFGLKQIIRMASSIILTRLLFPEAYGLMAMANVYLIGLMMFSDMGLRHAIIQNKRGEEPAFLNTAWTMQAIRGFMLWVVSCIIAYPVAQFYNEPLLFPILCVLGASAAVRGFQTTAMFTANRRLHLGRLTILELVSQVIGMIVTIIWALTNPSVWALVGGNVVMTMITVPLGFFILPSHRHRFMWNKELAREMIHFGKWIFLATILGYFTNNGDRLILSKFMSAGEFGLYAVALTWMSIIVKINEQLGDRVMLAVYAETQNAEVHQLRKKIFRMRSAKSMLLLPLVCLFIIFGPKLIEVVYDDRYLDAGWMLQILAAGVGFNIATHVGEFYLAKGHSRLFMCVVAIRSVIMLLCMALGGHYAGGMGIIIGVAVTNLMEYPVLVMIYRRYGVWIWKLDLILCSVVFLAVAVAWMNLI